MGSSDPPPATRLDLGVSYGWPCVSPPNPLSPPHRPRRRSRLSQLLLPLLLVLLYLPCSISVSLTVSTQPSVAVGGEAFGVQPVVNFLDDSGNLHSTFSGYAYATLQESLTGFEYLYFGGSIVATDNIVPVLEGRATFTGLTLNEAGSGYKIRFIGKAGRRQIRQHTHKTSLLFLLTPRPPLVRRLSPRPQVSTPPRCPLRMWTPLPSRLPWDQRTKYPSIATLLPPREVPRSEPSPLSIWRTGVGT